MLQFFSAWYVVALGKKKKSPSSHALTCNMQYWPYTIDSHVISAYLAAQSVVLVNEAHCSCRRGQTAHNKGFIPKCSMCNADVVTITSCGHFKRCI